MIVNCETPRSVEVALQSLAAADENLPSAALEECHAWALVKQHLESDDTEEQSEQNNKAGSLYARALQVYPLTRKGIDRLDYGRRDDTRQLEQLVLGVQATINSLIDNALLRISPKNFATRQVFNRCALIGRHYLAEIIPSEDDVRYKYVAEVEPEGLVEDLVTQLEQYLKSAADFDSAVYCTLSASLAFVLCCNVARGLTDQSANASYVLRLVRGYWLGLRNTTSKSVQQTIADNLILVTLWLFISPNTHLAPSSPYSSIETGLETVWAGLMHVIYLDASALKRRDITYWLYGMLYLLTNPKEYRLTPEDSQAIEEVLEHAVLEAGIPHQIKGEYYARFIQLISDQSSTEFAPQLLTALYNFRYYSPWDDEYLLPTPHIYTFVVESLCRSSGTDHWNAYQIIACCPVPKLSPKLAERLSSRNLIPQLSIQIESDDANKRVFATAQLWLLLNMSLHEPDRSRSDLSILEQELLKYSGLSNNLEKQEEAAEELEYRLATLLDQGDCLENFSQYSPKAKYLYRIFELMLQQRCAPLPKDAVVVLEEIPKRLRGTFSYVDLEREWSLMYPDAGASAENLEAIPPGL
ncbi:unnamed protein product [Rhizoctonia solani]|nr:unnamed protein product [Rhizoctonia solani]